MRVPLGHFDVTEHDSPESIASALLSRIDRIMDAEGEAVPAPEAKHADHDQSDHGNRYSSALKKKRTWYRNEISKIRETLSIWDERAAKMDDLWDRALEGDADAKEEWKRLSENPNYSVIREDDRIYRREVENIERYERYLDMDDDELAETLKAEGVDLDRNAVKPGVTDPCTRCGGTGYYGGNVMDGLCFRCGGTGQEPTEAKHASHDQSSHGNWARDVIDSLADAAVRVDAADFDGFDVTKSTGIPPVEDTEIVRRANEHVAGLLPAQNLWDEEGNPSPNPEYAAAVAEHYDKVPFGLFPEFRDKVRQYQNDVSQAGTEKYVRMLDEAEEFDAPLIEWDPETDTYVVGDGYHRLVAMIAGGMNLFDVWVPKDSTWAKAMREGI